MASVSNKLENAFIDWFFRGQAIGITGASAAAGTGPTNLYIGLFTVTPTAAGGGTEVTTVSSGYARATIVSSLANWAGTQGAGTTVASTGTSGQTSNNSAIPYGPPTAAWGTILGIGVFDALTGGNLLYYSPLAASKTVNSGDAAPSFAAGALTVTVS